MRVQTGDDSAERSGGAGRPDRAGRSGPEGDADLLLAVGQGDRAAFESLYRRYAAWLVLRLRYRCADASLVDDIVQETFLAVWHGSAGSRAAGSRAAGSRAAEPANVAGLLWRIAFRRLVDALRAGGARHRLLQRLARSRGEAALSAEEELLLDVEHGDLAGSLRRLSPELRAVIQATVLDGLSTREAATLLAIPVSTVKTRALRARRQLRRELT